MRDDPIVEETRAARRELHDEFGGDMAAVFNYLKEIERENADRGREARAETCDHTEPRGSVVYAGGITKV